MVVEIPWFAKEETPTEMREVDMQIMKLLADSDLELSSNNIARNLDYTSQYMRDRLLRLVDEGYVEKSSGAGDPFYWITEEGRDYLREHADADDG